MRDLKPTGFMITIGKKEYKVLFTYDVVDTIQSETGQGFIDFIVDFVDFTKQYKEKKESVVNTLMWLTQNKVKRNEIEKEITCLNIYSYIQNILQACIETLPKRKEHEVSKGEPMKNIDVARILYLGKAIMHYPESEIWEMTPRKFDMLFREHLKEIGAINEEKLGTIDDL